MTRPGDERELLAAILRELQILRAALVDRQQSHPEGWVQVTEPASTPNPDGGR